MSASTLRQDYASSLLVDVRATHAPLPRREALTMWLQDYLKLPATGDRELEAALATENLLAINAHLRAFGIPATARPKLN
jgi:hypothetical protein